MLQRDRQFRTQLHQWTDACMFAAAFWAAYAVRSNDLVTAFLGWDHVGLDSFNHVYLLFFLLIPAGPLVLESQGFYNRPMLGSRAAMFWPLLKSCFILVVGLILLVFLFRESSYAPRSAMIFFGIISFGLVWLKEELMRLVLQSRMARAQYKRRVV